MPVFETNTSRLKMVILTKPKHQNKTWWSPIKHNRRTDSFIINGMLGRLKRSKLFQVVQVVQFYENGRIIAEFKATEI